MKILMIQAISMDDVNAEKVYPIGIVTLATHLELAGHTVDLIDMNLEVDPFYTVKSFLLKNNPDAVCISLRNIDPLGNKTSSLIPQFVIVNKMIKKLQPNTMLISGGTGFSLFPKELMELSPEIDFGLIGEGEVSLVKLLENANNPGKIKGLVSRKNMKIEIEEPSKEFDMENEYIVPNRELLSLDKYLAINNYVESVGVETKRGCPFNCSYCVYPSLQGKKLRVRNPKDVVDELENLVNNFNVKRIHFTDPVVNIPKGHLEEICSEIIIRKLDIKWSGFFREDHIDENNIFLFEKSGCECFSFSPDGLCQESLNVLGKNLTEERILRTAELAAKTDVVCVYHFMVNVPGENSITYDKSVEMIDKIYEIHKKRRNLGTVVLNNIRIMPSTPIHDYAKKALVVTENTDLIYPIYYNPEPFKSMRYKLETQQLEKNIFMWQGVDSNESTFG